MRVGKSGMYMDNPASKLLEWLGAYEDRTTAAGNAGGTTVVCAGLAAEPSYDGALLKILDGPAAGQFRPIAVHAGNTLTVGVGFTNAAGAAQQIAAGIRFVIISLATGGGGPGPAPEESLTYYGIVDAVPGANQFTIAGLAGLGAGKFAGATNPYQAFVLRDAGGASAAPQGEYQAITAYTTGTGNFTTAAFTAAVGIGDEILILHPAIANVLVILAGLAVPAADAAANALMRDLTGNKADTALYAATATASLMRYLKAVLHTEVLAIGTFTTSSATVPADNLRAEANDAWKGCLLMPLVAGAGPTAFQPKRIEAFTNAGGIFTIDPGNPFTSATGLVAYAILPAQADFVPAADSVLNVSTAEAVGNKADTAVQALSATSSQMRYLKGIMDALLTAAGITAWPASAPPANGVSLAEAIRQIYDDLVATQATLAGMPVSSSLYNTTQTTQGATITLFQLDALAGNIDDIEVEFYLAADAAATFTPTWELTRPGDLVTFTTQLIPAIATIVTPGAAGVYRYQVGNIPQGLSGRFRLAQNGLGAANVLCDATCTYKA